MTDVQTVLGPIDSGDLGVTLPHEHILTDARPWWHAPAPDDAAAQRVAHAPVSIELLGWLRYDPFISLENMQLLDEGAATDELALYGRAGGQSILDMTTPGMGRDARALQRIARATGLHVVAGTGYYLEKTHPPEVAAMDSDGVAEALVRDLTEGCDGTVVRAGVIGEIGVSADFTPAEEKVLRGAARAQARTRVPLSVHLPGWERLGHRVLDVIESEGVAADQVVLGHMNPSLDDVGYQDSLAHRGAWLEFDMIGMDYYYADQTAQSPCDEENARAIVRLMHRGHAARLLLSSDTFLKTMLVRYGGFGYAHVITRFADRLRRHGVRETELTDLFVDNPRRLFDIAAGEVNA